MSGDTALAAAALLVAVVALLAATVDSEYTAEQLQQLRDQTGHSCSRWC